jgi:UDP-N-acetylmuramoyl-tripeptide--D-alanyl-D-alanine ligase
MLRSNTKDIAKVLGLNLSKVHSDSFDGICTDSRQDVKGKLFIALIGDSFDAHNYIDIAYDKGAVAAIVSKNVNTKLPTLLVKNTQQALSSIATWHLKNIDPIVIAITGSNGKTTTKNLLANILSLSAHTLSTRGNFNNHLGVPLTILDLNKSHKYAVIEMGANHLNEINHLRNITKPDVAIVTNTHEAHIGEFGSIDNLIKAKGEIYSDESKNIVNTSSKFKGDISFGEGGDIFSTNITSKSFDLNIHDEKITVFLQLIGKHNIENALAASACAKALGIDIHTMKQGLEATSAEPGRLTLIHHKDMTILDDTYNASPQSVKAAINTLIDFKGEKVAVLGSMAELGNESIKFHKEIGQFAQSKVDSIYSFGDMAVNYDAHHFDNLDNLANHIIAKHPGANVLVKGSRMVGLDNLVEMLKNKY